MSYKGLAGIFTLLAFIAVAILYIPGSLEAAGQGQNSQRNSPPEFGSTRITRSVTENIAAGAVGDPITATDDDSDTLTYSIQTAPRGPFDIDSSTGQLRTTEPLNYEAMSTFQTPSYMLTSYRFVVRVRDAKYAYDEITVEINVVDVEEPGVVDLLWNQPQVGTPIVASLTDPDGEVADLTWQWARSTDKASWTDITSNGTSATYTPVDDDDGKYLRATASYTDRRGSGKTANAISDNQTRAVPDSNNAAPSFTNTNATRTIKENSPSGTHMGAAFQAMDSGDDIRYFLGGTDGGSFDIDHKSGQLKVKDPLNHESKETYSLKVFARDPTRAGDTSMETGTVAVTVTVRDVNERPKVSGDFKPTYAENSGSLLVTTLTGFDEDEDGPFKQNYYMGWLISGFGPTDGDFFYLDDSRDEVDIKFRVPPDFDNPADRNRDNVYDISMTAYSGRNDSTYFHVNVTVTDGNDEGVVEGPPSVNYPEGATRAVATYTISDTSQQTLAWSVTGTDGDKFTIKDGELNFKTSPDYNSPADYSRNNVYSVWVAASGDGVTAWKKVAVTVVEHNDPPVISGPTAPTFAENATETVAQYTATDADQDPITWSAGGTDGSYFDISSAGVLTFKSPPDFEARADNNYEVTVQAYDGTDTTDYPVTVTVTNVNEAPVFADATATRSIAENTATRQNIGDAFTATDPDAGDTLTYSLDQSSAAVFSIVASSGQLQTKAPLDHETTPSYSVTVKATDLAGASHDITVTVTVTDANEPPAFPSTETGARSIAENTAAGQPVGAPVAASDPDAGAILTYTLGGTDAASFIIVETSGQLQTKATLDLEMKPSYSLTVSVRDSKDGTGATDTADDATIDVTITVTNVNDAPAFDPGTATRDVPENTPADQDIGEPVEATDRDSGDTLTYSLDATSVEFFAIDSSGQLKTKAPLDYETTPSYPVIVKATDSAQTSDTIAVTITVTDNNDAPAFNSGLATTFEVAENTVAGTDIGALLTATDQDNNDTLTYSLSGTGAAVFDIDSTNGQLQTKGPLDFETKSSYTLTISVRDSRDAEGTVDTAEDASITVTVNVIDLAEDGTITLSSRQPQVGTAFTATLSDPNIASPVVTWAWEKSTNKTLWTTIASATDAAYTPIAGDVGAWLKVTARYNDGQQGSDDKSAQAESEFGVRAAPTGGNNAPAFSAETVTRQVYDNVAVESKVGSPVTATDPDSDDLNRLTYTLSGTDAESFDIDAGSGQIRTAIALDYDTRNSYEVIVIAKDPSLESDTVTVTIGVIKYVRPRPPGGGGGSNSNRPTNSKPAFDQSGTVQLSVPENTKPEVAIGDPITATDANDAQLAYAIQAGSDGASFDIDSSSGQLKTKANLDYEVKATYSLSVSVTDGKDANGNPDTAADDTIAVTITVIDANDAPAFNSGLTTNFEVAENTLAGVNIGDALTATDQDDDALTYTLGGTGAASFRVDAKTGQLKTSAPLDFESGTIRYSITVSVHDGLNDAGNPDTAADDTIAVTITVTDANDAPAFNSGLTTNFEVAENTLAGVNIGDALTATDQDDDALTYTLGGTGAASFRVDAKTGQLKTSAPLDFESGTIRYSVTVSVHDGLNDAGNPDTAADDTIAVTITVTDANDAPAFNSGLTTNFEVAENTVAGVNIGDALTATDQDDDALTYTLGGTGAASFRVDAKTGQLKTSAPLDFESGTIRYSVTVSVHDGLNDAGNPDTAADDTIAVTITVTDANDAPAFNSGLTTNFEVAENTVAGVNIGDALTATDQDDDALTYTLGGTGAASFRVDAKTGQLKTSAPLDFESGTIRYSVTVSVHDGLNDAGNPDTAADDTIAVTITVTDANDAPAFNSGLTTNFEVAENTVAGVNIGDALTATDQDNNDSLTYTLDETSAAVFDIDSNDIDSSGGQLKTKAPLDYESKASYSVAVSVHDGKNSAGSPDTVVDATVTVTITVTDVNEPPAFASETATREVVENTASGRAIGDAFTATDQDQGDTLTYTLDATSAAVFDIDSNGQLRTKGSLDYDTTASYTVTISVRDSKADDGTADTVADDSISVTITVIDVAAVRMVTLSPRQPQVGTAFTATLVDPEIPSPSMAWAWERSTDKSAWTAITGAKAATYTPVTSDLNNYLRATVIYNDGQGGNSKAARAVSEFQVRAAPAQPNTAPAFATETDTRSIVEGADTNRNVGAPVTATDDDSYDANLLTYTLDGLDAESFSIVESSGQIKTKIALVHADQATYTVTVTATDPSLASDTITVTINVTQVVVPRQTRSSGGGGGGSRAAKPANPEPEFVDGGPVTIRVPENTDPDTAIGDPLTATDDDDTELTYSIDNWSDGASFDIDASTGQLKTKAPLDYETKANYELRVKVIDDDGGSDRVSVRISVTGVPEAPVVSGDTAVDFAENSSGRVSTYTASDPEESAVTWEDLSGDDAAAFSMANGVLSFRTAPDHEAPTDTGGDNVYNVTIGASDGTDTGTLDVAVTVTNVVDVLRMTNTGTEGSDSSGRSVGSSGNSGGKASNGVTVSQSYPENGTDPVVTYGFAQPEGNNIAWSLTGDDSGEFSITDGALSFSAPPDYETPTDSGTDNGYEVTVRVSDGTNTVSHALTVNVTNVNEGPTLTGGPPQPYAEQGTGSVAEYSGTDPEGDDLGWSVSGDDSDAFSIDGGVLSFATAPDYEQPSDASDDNVYEVTVEVSDGTYTDTLGVSVTVTDIQEVPITNPATQAVGKVYPESETTIETPDDVAAATFPVNSRATLYMVRVDSDPTNCSGGVTGSPDPNDYNLRVCLSVDIFDTWGNQEQDVTLDSAASISLIMDADDLGGADVVRQAYQDGGISTYTRSGSDDPWSVVEFTLSIDDESIVTITVTGITSFSSFAASTDDAVFQEVINPTPASTPAPTPAPTSTPRPESRERSGPMSMVAGSGVLRIPPRPGSAAMSVQASPSTPDDTSQEGQPAPQEASAGTILVEVVNSPLWALILMIIGSLMAIAGAGLIAKPYFPRPRYIK